MSFSCFEFSDLSGGYGDIKILDQVSGKLCSGEILGVVGRNGVGKTTLAKTLNGSLPASNGIIALNGINITSNEAFERRRMGLGYMAQTSMVFDNLTVKENLSLAGNNSGLSELISMFPILGKRRDQLAGLMSGGERKILAFARTMLEETQVIIIDEPSEGVQPENIVFMEDCIKRRSSEGHAVILIEQNLNILLNLADSYLGLDSGSTVFSGSRRNTTRDDLLNIMLV